MNSITQRTRKTKTKVIAAIPCLNEGQFISDIVTRTRKYADVVIVIDDGSTDNTAGAAEKAGAKVIKHEARRGAGAATRPSLTSANSKLTATTAKAASSWPSTPPPATTTPNRSRPRPPRLIRYRCKAPSSIRCRWCNRLNSRRP